MSKHWSLVLAFGLTELAANLLAAYVKIPLWFMLIPGGAFLIPIALLIRDQLHLQYRSMLGYALVVGALASILTMDLSVMRVAIASILAYLVSFGVDTVVFEAMKGRSLPARMRGSNWASLPIDTVIFVPVAFAGLFPIMPLILGQVFAKLTMTEVAVWIIRRSHS